MSVYMTRQDGIIPSSNTLGRPGSLGPFRFFEKTYTSGTTQEWIYLPDAIWAVGVTLSAIGGSSSIDVTDSPPDVIESGSPAAVTWDSGSIASSVKSVALIGYTAIRVNIASGTAKISVRA